MKIVKKIVTGMGNIAINQAEKGLQKSILFSMYEIKVPESLKKGIDKEGNN